MQTIVQDNTVRRRARQSFGPIGSVDALMGFRNLGKLGRQAGAVGCSARLYIWCYLAASFWRRTYSTAHGQHLIIANSTSSYRQWSYSDQ